MVEPLTLSQGTLVENHCSNAFSQTFKQFSMSDKRMGQTKLIRDKIIFEKKIVAAEKQEREFWTIPFLTLWR